MENYEDYIDGMRSDYYDARDEDRLCYPEDYDDCDDYDYDYDISWY